MTSTNVGSVTLEYETRGDPSDPAILLVMGLGAQMTLWDEGFVDGLVERGFHVVRFDNRDVGLSSKTEGAPPDLMALFGAIATGGALPDVPYTLSDMAADAIGLLDHLGIDRAHVVGASMGGMIAQTMAIEHPGRVRSLTSIMSTTGDPTVGQADPEVMALLVATPPPDREGAIEATVATSRAISGPLFDEEVSRARAARQYDRAFHPVGVAFQLAAIVASGDRTDGLAKLDVPALVVHGRVDPLVTLSGGQATAAAIPDAELVVLDEMGHDLPPALWPKVFDAIEAVAARAV